RIRAAHDRREHASGQKRKAAVWYLRYLQRQRSGLNRRRARPASARSRGRGPDCRNRAARLPRERTPPRRPGRLRKSPLPGADAAETASLWHAFSPSEKSKDRPQQLDLSAAAPDCVQFFQAMDAPKQEDAPKPENDRLAMLTQFLEQNPSDAFARYGLAMELNKLGRIEAALEQFNKLVELHPDYTNGYFMA